MTSKTQTIEISNPLIEERTFELTDAAYIDMPVESGTINLSRI